MNGPRRSRWVCLTPTSERESVGSTSEAATAVDNIAVNGNSCGGGNICGNPTWTRPQSPTGWNNGNFPFTDTAPAGSTATTVKIELYGVGCGSGGRYGSLRVG